LNPPPIPPNGWVSRSPQSGGSFGSLAAYKREISIPPILPKGMAEFYPYLSCIHPFVQDDNLGITGTDFYRPDALYVTQPTVSMHCRKCCYIGVCVSTAYLRAVRCTEQRWRSVTECHALLQPASIHACCGHSRQSTHVRPSTGGQFVHSGRWSVQSAAGCPDVGGTSRSRASHRTATHSSIHT